MHRYGRERFAEVTDGRVRDVLHPMLSGSDRPRAAELVERAWASVVPLLLLTEAEREYTDRLQHGELCPELLCPDDPDLADRLRRHPGLLWKAENARRRAGRG